MENDKKKTKYELIKEEIERISYEHEEDAGAMIWRIDGRMAEYYYRKLLEQIHKETELTQEEVEELEILIQQKIAKIPEVEAKNNADYERGMQLRRDTFEEAKSRWDERSLFKKIIDRIKKRDPNSLDSDFMTITEMDQLYR